MKKYFLLLSLLLASFAKAEENSNTLKLAMGPAPMEVLEKIKDGFEKKSGIKIVLLQDEAGLGADVIFKMIDSGIADGGATGASFEEWMKIMKEKGVVVKDPKMYQPHSFGKGFVNVFTHKGVGIKKLNKDQLTKIFTGIAKNWKEVGGPDLPIVVVRTGRQPATEKAFVNAIMKDKVITDDAVMKEHVKGMIAHVAATPGAVAMGPSSVGGENVDMPTTPTVSRPYTFLTKGKPKPNAKKLLDYLKNEGSKYL